MNGAVGPFWNISWRYLLRHPWQTALMILGVTLGVAVVVAIDLANASASQAFQLSTDAITGRTTHQVVGSPGGLPEAHYTRLRLSGLPLPSAPVLAEYTSSPQLGGRPIQLLGVDPFAETPFRDYFGGPAQSSVDDLSELLTRPGAVLLSTGNAERFGLTPGETIQLDIGGRTAQATIAGFLEPTDSLSRRVLDGLILADLSSAQELSGRLGVLDRIDLILPQEESHLLEDLRSLLPPDARVVPVGSRTGSVAQMTAAFQTNLTALSLLAMVVGIFLIYNTMTFSVIQRRELFGTLRCLGVTRTEIFGLVTSEALIVGLLSAVLGSVLGILLGRGAVQLVTQTLNDLFFVVTVSTVTIPTSSLIKGAALGIITTTATAIPPAWEAASIPPWAALSQSSLEDKARWVVSLAAIGGGGLVLAGVLILALPTQDLAISFIGTFAIVVGFALLTPLIARLALHFSTPILGRIWGSLGRMAPRDVAGSLSRTGIAIAALMVAVSVIIGVSLMVGSFRYTVVVWLAHTLQGDVYISVPSPTASQNRNTVDPAATARAAAWPGVARVDQLRSIWVDAPQGAVHLAAVDNPRTGHERLFQWSEGDAEEIWQAMREGAVLVSEPFANRYPLQRQNPEIVLYTAYGPHSFPVAGVYYDYSSSQGTVMMNMDVYQNLWQDTAITALALRLDPGQDPDQLALDIQEGLAPLQSLRVQPNQALRQEALAVFDRTFAITQALQILATLVAFIGVLSALLSLQLEKQRQFGILRSIGLTVRQLWGLTFLETGLMGAIAGLLAMPTGLSLALILIYIINKRSFGWTLQLNLVADPFLDAFIIALLAALLAGIYPARRLGSMITADAMRYD